MLRFLIFVCGIACRLVTAPRDAWSDFRRFFSLHALKVGMQGGVTAPMIIGGGLLLVGLLLWIVGWLFAVPIVIAVGVVQFTLVFRLLVGYLWFVLVGSVLYEVF